MIKRKQPASEEDGPQRTNTRAKAWVRCERILSKLLMQDAVLVVEVMAVLRNK